MGIVRVLATEALSLGYDDIPEADVHQVKRLVLDSLACTLGGREAPTVQALLSYSDAVKTDAEGVGLISLGRRASVLDAVLVNGAMLRYLDMNDIQHSEVTPGPGHGHNSEVMPTAFGLAEKLGQDGRSLISAIWLGYEIATRFTESIRRAGPALLYRGWNVDTRAAFVIPFVAGWQLGLTPAQVEHAVGIALSRGGLLEVMDNPGEQSSMAKNLRFPLGAQLGITAARLAQHGITGPPRALEGGDGFIETVLDGAFDADHLLNAGWRGRVHHAGFKRFAACGAQHGHLEATLQLVEEHDVAPQDVVGVQIRTGSHSASHTGDPSRRHPTEKETADHSCYYVQAVLIHDRELGPAQYAPEKLADPEIARLADCVEIEADPDYTDDFPSATVTLTLRDGSSLERFVDQPPGYSPNIPLRDDQVETKFRTMARGTLTSAMVESWIHAVWQLDTVDVGDLMKLLVSTGQ